MTVIRLRHNMLLTIVIVPVLGVYNLDHRDRGIYYRRSCLCFALHRHLEFQTLTRFGSRLISSLPDKGSKTACLGYALCANRALESVAIPRRAYLERCGRISR